MRTITIDRTSALPPVVQIKDHIKLAYCFGRLREGDVMPSIRALADQFALADLLIEVIGETDEIP